MCAYTLQPSTSECILHAKFGAQEKISDSNFINNEFLALIYTALRKEIILKKKIPSNISHSDLTQLSPPPSPPAS